MTTHVTGIDLTPAMIEQAKILQQQRGLQNIVWNIGDVTHLPYNYASFSLVVTRYSFHHMLDPASVLNEMIRVCIPGGRIAMWMLCLKMIKLMPITMWKNFEIHHM